MKGLIYKDLLSLKQIVITMGFLAVFYVALGVMGKSGGDVVNYFPMLALVINMMASLTCAGYDEQCGWDAFGAALPVSRRQTVIARYGMNLLVMLLTTAVAVVSEFLYHGLYGTPISAVEILYPVLGSLLYVAVINPIVYKFGANKSRLIIAAVLVVPVILFSGLVMVLLTSPMEDEDEPPSWSVDVSASDEAEEDMVEIDVFEWAEEHSVPLTVGLSTVCVGTYALSMLLSISIYRKKEF